MELMVFPTYLILGIILSSLPHSLQDCARPTNLNPNVAIDPDQSSYSTWFAFVASCPEGYTQSGPTGNIYCTSGSPDFWNPDPSTVTCAASCSKPLLTDTTVSITPDQESYTPGEFITFSCSSGAIVGPTTSTCQSDGDWDYSTEPLCPVGCDVPANTDGTGPYGHTDQDTFTCNPGYALQGSISDSVTSTCSSGVWSPAVICESSGCPPPDVPSNANYTNKDLQEPTPSGYFSVNSKVGLYCMGEKTPFGPEFSYCNESNQWNPDPMILKCYDKCTGPSLEDSRVVITSDLNPEDTEQASFDHTDTVRFSCLGGIFVDGPWRASCNNGVWSPVLGGHRPACRDNCTAPMNTDNDGQVFIHGQAHVFQCDGTPGMLRLGGPRAFCNDGAWKPNIRCALKTEL